MIGPSWIRCSWFGFCGDWPCLAVTMIVVELGLAVGWICRTIAAELCVDVVEGALQERARERAAVDGHGSHPAPARCGVVAVRVRADQRRRESSIFSATETVWKFIPKIAGVPTSVLPEWS